jgi:ubiquinone/menaquinone biosynthesis C-methylase UbiE
MSQPDQLFGDGKLYEWQMGRWSRLAGDVFIDWLKLPSGLAWLDVGCGNGAFTEALVARCAPSAVAAVDPSEGQLAYARQRPRAAMVDFRVGGGEALPFGDGSFDVAVMALAITFVPDAAQAVAEMARVVRPGGWVATYMWDTLSDGSPHHPLTAAATALGVKRILAPSTTASQRETMQALWQAAGLTAIETRVIQIPVVYPNFDDFWESNIVPTGLPGKMVQGMAPTQRKQLRATLRDSMVAADGRVCYEARANAVKGQLPR